MHPDLAWHRACRRVGIMLQTTMRLLDPSLDGRSGVSHRQGVPGIDAGDPHLSHLSLTCLTMRGSLQKEMKGEKLMTIQEAMNKATAGGYQLNGSDGMETYYEG